MDRIRRVGIAVVLAGLAVAGSARADIRVQVRESINGAPPVPVIHWFGPQRAMRDDGSHYIVTRLDQHKIYIVDRETKKYRVVDLNLQAAGAIQPVTVKRTNDTRTIGQWPARRYRITGPGARNLTIDIWVSETVGVDIDAFRHLMVSLSRRPGSAWLAAYAKIDGFPVLQEVDLERPGIRLHSKSQVVSITQTTPKPNTYRPPPGFTEVR